MPQQGQACLVLSSAVLGSCAGSVSVSSSQFHALTRNETEEQLNNEFSVMKS